MKYKIAYSGIQVIEVEADSRDEAEKKFWNESLNELSNAEIEEIVPVDQPFEMFMDLN